MGPIQTDIKQSREFAKLKALKQGKAYSNTQKRIKQTNISI